MDKDNQHFNRLPLANNWDYLATSNLSECRRESFGDEYDSLEPKTPEIIISKKKYSSICRNSINEHERGFYQEKEEDLYSFGKWTDEPPPPPPGPLKRSFASERIPSESFGEELVRITEVNLIRIEKDKEYKKKIFDEKVKNKYNNLMEFLTDKYYDQVVSYLKYNAECGKHEAYMNFTYEDFKANMPTLGKPRKIQSNWLHEMKNPTSSFLKGRRPLQDISFGCWGNGSFTVLFTW